MIYQFMINISYSSSYSYSSATGRGNLCALDVLSSTGLVNYFGKCDSIDSVEVSPLLLKKGETKLALYGLGCIRDERLHRLFEQRRVKILKHRDNADSWFNLFTIHQVCACVCMRTFLFYIKQGVPTLQIW